MGADKKDGKSECVTYTVEQLREAFNAQMRKMSEDEISDRAINGNPTFLQWVLSAVAPKMTEKQVVEIDENYCLYRVLEEDDDEFLSEEEVTNKISAYSDQALPVYPEYCEAFVGIIEGAGLATKVVYDKNKVVEILMRNMNCNQEEAEEFFQYNVIGTYVNENTPAFITLAKNIK